MPEMNQQVAEQTAALADNWKQVAQDTFGNGLLRVGQDGKMTIDLRWGGGAWVGTGFGFLWAGADVEGRAVYELGTFLWV